MKTKMVVIVVLVMASLSFAIVSVFASPLNRVNPEGVSDTEESPRDCIFDNRRLLAGVTYAQPTAINVPADFPTIQAGIDAAEYGDIVLVAAGTYIEHIQMKSGVTVRGTGGSLLTPDNPSDDSIIDGGVTGRPVTFAGSQNATLVGFTITNGTGDISGGNIYCAGEANTIRENLIVNGQTVGSYGGYGGGIYLICDNAKVVDNVIRDNWAWASGGGIDIRAAGAIIEGNIINNNQSDWAGGINVSGPSTVIKKNIIDDNFADYRDGGGIRVTSAANSTIIENNTIVNNTANYLGFGGAVYVDGINELTIKNNLIVNNLNAFDRTGGIHFVSCPVTLTLMYNDVYNNQGNDYLGCVPGGGSISVDPLFVNTGNRDYHLQSGSPAIDAGDPDAAYYDVEDPANPGLALYPAMGTVRNDMGAYGGSGVEPFVPLDTVTVLGPTEGEIFETDQFTTTVAPSDATLPITYTWNPVPLSGQGTEQVTYRWLTIGDQHITVTAINAVGSDTDSHTISITATDHTDRGTGLSVTKRAGHSPVQDGTQLTYTLDVTNTTNVTLTATITDILPNHVTPTGMLNWGPFPIGPNTAWTQPVIVTVDAGYTGSLTNKVQVTTKESPSAKWAANSSSPTTCAEDDNINVPIFAPNKIRHFQVIASHPTYEVGEDNCAADFSGCSSDDVSTTLQTVDCQKIWDDGINVIKVCIDSNWWLGVANTMTVRVGNQSISGHRLVWHRKIEDEASWPEFMVLYQDGNMRLKPHPPLGRSDVCFGSSVIIGPAPSDPTRPFVKIEEVILYPNNMSLRIVYDTEMSGGSDCPPTGCVDSLSSWVNFSVDREQAVAYAEIDHVTSEPFVTFRSMYVSDGNADVDHIETAEGNFSFLNGSLPPWSSLSGPWWFFHRATRSRHNTSAPDILIKVEEGPSSTARVTVCANYCVSYLPIILKAQ